MMPTYCCVPGCTTTGSGHKFPLDPQMKKRWIIAIKRLDPVTKKIWQPSLSSVVCHNHFLPTDYRETLLGERKRLLPEAVPSLMKQNDTESLRGKRAENRRKSRKVAKLTDDCPAKEPYILSTPDADGPEVEVLSTSHQGPAQLPATSHQDPAEIIDEPCSDSVDIPVTSSNSNNKFSILKFKDDPSSVLYWTGLDDYEHFMFFFHVLGPATTSLKGLENIPLLPEDQLFLTLLKLRQGKDNKELGIFFGIKEQLVSRIFTVWINFMYLQLQELEVWPTRSVIDMYMPSDFGKSFPTTRVILDATEIPIQKPKCCGPQRETFSSYKNKNTLKVVVGCTPRGAVSYVSQAYGGSSSDRQIIERSSLVADKSRFEKRDSIMADRGILVQDLFANKDVTVNTPTLLKGKSQLEPEQLHHDRKVASKRIHVERIIGLAKTYKILKTDLNANYITLGNRIIHVCFYLCNFRRCIVKKNG